LFLFTAQIIAPNRAPWTWHWVWRLCIRYRPPSPAQSPGSLTGLALIPPLHAHPCLAFSCAYADKLGVYVCVHVCV
jgi:hypothetical protein